MMDQIALPGLDEIGISAAEYVDRLLTLMQKFMGGVVQPQRYLAEINKLKRLREAGQMSEQSKVALGCLEGLAVLKAKASLIEKDYGQAD